LSSRVDHVVPIESGDRFETSVSGPTERIFLERSFHVATLDWDAPLIEQRVTAFAAEVLGGPGVVVA
jgi:esterase/lipase